MAGTAGEFFKAPNQQMPESEQFEIGLRAAPLDWLSLGVAAFHIDTSNDLTTNVALGRLENIGHTRRRGLELSADAAFASGWRAAVNYTWQEAVYVDTARNFTIIGVANPNYDVSGRRLDDTPRHIVNALVAYEPETGLGGRASFWWYGSMVRNDIPEALLAPDNREDYRMAKPPTSSLDLQLSWRFNDTYKLTLDVMNLANRRNIGFAAPTPMTPRGYVYSLQPPTTFHLGFEANWR